MLGKYHAHTFSSSTVVFSGCDYRTKYTYDDVDRLTSESRFGNQPYAINYSYDGVGNRLTKTNGSMTVSYSYQSGCNRLTGWTAVSTNNFADLLQTDISGSSSETIGTNIYLGQLSVTNLGGQGVMPVVSGSTFTANSFTLAAGSNQIVAAIGDAVGNVGYATNVVINQIVTNGSYSYSSAGCITTIGYSGAGFTNNMGLTWNDQYQLTSIATNGVTAEQNGFDVLGRRIWNWDGTTTNWFVYDGTHALAEVDGTGALRRAYTHGPGVDNWLAMTVYTGATVKTYFYITDHLGTVHAVTDLSGNIVESYQFDAWGRVLGVFDGSGRPLTQSAIGNKILWQGREYSWATGLYFFRARWYDPITGRWLSNDPIGISGGLNQYVFCGDNPVNKRDPMGLCGNSGPSSPYSPWTNYGNPVSGPNGPVGPSDPFPIYPGPPSPPVPINGPIGALTHYMTGGGVPGYVGPDLQQRFINQQLQGALPTTPAGSPPVNTAISGDFIITATFGQFRYQNNGQTTTISDVYAFPYSQSDWSGGTTYHNAGLSWIPGTPYPITGTWPTPTNQ
jgi:RHS repeat-associated protein